MFLSKLKTIKAFILDVDGVLTDGSILVTESGEQQRKFNIKDGFALQLAVKRAYKIAVVSGGKSEGVRLRLQGLGLTAIHLGVKHKTEIVAQFLKDHQLTKEEVLFIGDDLPDLKAMQMCGLACCPADAVEEIKAISDYISPLNGGFGVVRDIFEKTLKLQGNWFEDEPEANG